MFSFFFKRSVGSARRRAGSKPTFQPTLERLETRDLPSITLIPNSGVLVARGDDGGVTRNDTFELRIRPDNGQFEIHQSAGIFTMARMTVPASVNQIVIVGDGGTDAVVVKALPPNITLTASDMEVFSVGNNQSLAGILGNMTLTSNSGGPRTAVTFDDSADATGHPYDHAIRLTRDGVTGLTPQGAMDFSRAKLSSLTINVGSGADTFAVLSTPGNTTLNSGGGFDRVDVGFGPDSPHGGYDGDLGGLRGTLTVNGNGSLDLYASDRQSPVQNPAYVVFADHFTRSNQVTLPDGSRVTQETRINYSGCGYANFSTGGVGTPNVRVKSTAASGDTVVVIPGNVPVVVGNDAYRLDDIRGQLAVYNTLFASGGPASGGPVTLFDVGSTAAHGYTIDSVSYPAMVLRDDGVRIQTFFVAEVDLFGGSAADTFTLGYIPPLRLSLNGGGGLDTLIGTNQANTFTITGGGTDTGEVGSHIAFAGIENLTGGTGDDTFVIKTNMQGVAGSLSGRIDGGGGGINTLDYTMLTTGVTVDLAAHTATGVAGGVFGIRNVIGSRGDDLLRGDDNANELRGVDGNDILIGLGGDDHLFARGIDGVGAATTRRNILIGGTGSDVLNGSEGEDILLGGYFENNLDLNDAVLRAFLEVWKGPGTYGERTQTLNVVGVNGFKVNDPNIRLHDGAIDTVLGNGGLDWFWSEDQDLTDRIVGQEERNDV